MSGTVSATWTKPLLGYRIAETFTDDTLQIIAARELGDASQWPDLVALNGLVPPYLTNDPFPAPGLLTAGLPIKVPSSSAAPSGVASQDDIYGVDLLLENGFLIDNGAGDLATTAGLPNLEQALLIRIATRPGELAFHPDYGCRVHELIGQGASSTINGLANAFVASAVASDPRIASTDGGTSTVTGDTIAVAIVPTTIGGKQLPINVSTGASTSAGSSVVAPSMGSLTSILPENSIGDFAIGESGI